MSTYRIVIRVDGEGNAEGFLGGIHNALGGLASVAGGTLLAGGIASLGSALGGTIGQALEATKAYENLGMSLESLVAREIRAASGVEKMVTVGQQRIQLTQKEIAEVEKLKQAITDETLKRDILGAKIQEQQERIRQLTMQYGENGLVVIKERAELAQMENQLGKTGAAIDKYGARISELEGKQGQLVNVTQKMIEGQLSMNEALEQAGPKAQELLDWVQKLAIQSPFKQMDIANAFKTAMAYGFTTDEAKKLTSTLVDFSAVVDPTGQKMGLIAYALGQIRTSDKLLTQDLRQLMNAGVDVNAILGKMGFKLSDVGEKAISSKDFLKVFMETMDQDFGGAAKRTAGSLTGLLSSLDDIKEIGLRNLFEGAFGAMKPLLQGMVDTFSDPAFMASLRGIGKWIGDGVTTAIGWIQQGISWVKRFADEFNFLQQMGKSPLEAIQSILRQLVPPELRPLLNAVFERIALLANFVTGVLLPGLRAAGPQITGFFQGALNALLGALPGIMAAGTQLISWIFATLVPALVSFGQTILTTALPTLQQMATWLTGTLIPALAQFIGWLSPNVIQPFGDFLIGVLIPALGQFAAFVVGTVLPAVGGLAMQFWNWLVPVVQQLANWFTTTLIPALTQFAAWLGVNIPAAVTILQAGLQNLQPLWNTLGRGVSATMGILQSLAGIWSNVNRLVAELQTYLGNVISNFLGIDRSAEATRGRLDSFGQFLTQVGQIIMQFYENQLAWLLRGFEMLVGFLEEVAKWLGIVADALANLKVPDAFERHSPSPFEQMLMNSNFYLREMVGLIPNSLGALGRLNLPALAPVAAVSGALPYRAARAESSGRQFVFNGPLTIRSDTPREWIDFIENQFGGYVWARVRMGE